MSYLTLTANLGGAYRYQPHFAKTNGTKVVITELTMTRNCFISWGELRKRGPTTHKSLRGLCPSP